MLVRDRRERFPNPFRIRPSSAPSPSGAERSERFAGSFTESSAEPSAEPFIERANAPRGAFSLALRVFLPPAHPLPPSRLPPFFPPSSTTPRRPYDCPSRRSPAFRRPPVVTGLPRPRYGRSEGWRAAPGAGCRAPGRGVPAISRRPGNGSVPGFPSGALPVPYRVPYRAGRIFPGWFSPEPGAGPFPPGSFRPGGEPARRERGVAHSPSPVPEQCARAGRLFVPPMCHEGPSSPSHKTSRASPTASRHGSGLWPFLGVINGGEPR